MQSDIGATSVQKNDAELLNLLRQATHEVHERLHVHPLTMPLLSSSLTRQHYIDVLKAFYGFHKPMETKVESYRKISQAELIKRDLEYLGDKIEVTLCSELPMPETFFERLGYWYVLEGSSLGSKLIYKNLQKHLGIHAETGARFFYAYGTATGRNWHEFKSFLSKQEPSSEEIKQILKSARDTFSCLEKWFWQYGRGKKYEQQN